MRFALIVLFLLSFASCSQLYYASMEKLGKEKRDILVQRVVDGKKDQEKAKEQIQTTLEVFQQLTGFEGGELEKTYKKLNSAYEDADSRAKALSDRVASIDKVGQDLFAEWEKEISGMSNQELRSRSQQLLRTTRSNHQQYLRRMRTTEKKIAPVIQAFRDQVTFLKHNLNAKAVGSLKKTSAKLDADVGSLVTDLEGSITEADRFIQTLSTTES
jgi:ElaB/YqjD/DUF883 family membrane-anchored ribosome-binding protein